MQFVLGGRVVWPPSKTQESTINLSSTNHIIKIFYIIYVYHICHVKGHFHVENMIQFYNPPKRNKNRRKNTRNKDGEEFDTCQICHEIYPANKLKEHQGNF